MGAAAAILLGLSVLLDSVLYWLSALIDAACIIGASYMVYLAFTKQRSIHRAEVTKLRAEYALLQSVSKVTPPPLVEQPASQAILGFPRNRPRG